MSAIEGRLRAALADRRDVAVAALFGSRARGTARADSDVDLVVVGDVDVLDLGARLSMELGLEVDVVAFDDASIPLLEHLARDAIVVHEARPGGGALWRSRLLATLETDRPWFARMSDAWLARVAEQGLPRG